MKTSIALCTYNGGKYLKEQLESILAQTVLPDEIVVCDDGSTDDTKNITEQYRQIYPLIFKVFNNEKNLGYAKNFEKAITLCTGDLIFLSDQDDVWKKNKIEVMRNTAEQNPEIHVFAHRIEILEKNGDVLSQSFWDIDGFNPNSANSETLKYLLFERNVFPGMSLAITRNAREKYLPLKSPHQLVIHDYEIILKSCRDNAFKAIDESLTLYRTHENQNIGFNKNFVPTNELKPTDIYININKIAFIKKMVISFNLSKTLIEEYREKCRSDYKKFIKNMGFPKNWIIHLKMKYYYKVLHEIR
ncbi:glycosyltransferase [Chryseobacterium koreense]|uniref:glycosyltransferase n=1 Tax=Chryseobacterium koreense TaxID=232216 RepID=UPI0026EC838F|nr:glycosyltransferase [Chryseobacterium koreense]